MRHLFIRLLAAGAALWAAGAIFLSKAAQSKFDGKHAAIDPKDPAAKRSVGPAPVRSAGPEAMRAGHPEWDKVDQAVDESFPASDPPSR